MTDVSRDPFARTTLHKTRVPGSECAWCGCIDTKPAVIGGPRYGPVYRYRIESDGGRNYEDSRPFCSRSCRTAYYS
jgi:hypothetical protein